MVSTLTALQPLSCTRQFNGSAEVDQLHLQFIVEEDVLRFDVSMHDVTIMY